MPLKQRRHSFSTSSTISTQRRRHTIQIRPTSPLQLNVYASPGVLCCCSEHTVVYLGREYPSASPYLQYGDVIHVMCHQGHILQSRRFSKAAHWGDTNGDPSHKKAQFLVVGGPKGKQLTCTDPFQLESLYRKSQFVGTDPNNGNNLRIDARSDHALFFQARPVDPMQLAPRLEYAGLL